MGQLLLVVAAGVLGWSMGLVSAWLADCVLRLHGAPLKHSTHLLAREPLLQSGLAATWMILLAVGGLSWQVGAAALVAIPLVQVAVTDLQYGYVYTVVAGCGIALSLALAPLVHMASPWTGLTGAAIGLLSMALLRMFGRMAYSGEAMGRGDVTIATMVGAAAGPGVLVALAVGLVLNGVLGLYVLLSRRSPVARMPYGSGFCLGGLILACSALRCPLRKSVLVSEMCGMHELDGTWEQDWPRTIAALETFVGCWPGYAATEDKLYAALVADGDAHIQSGQGRHGRSRTGAGGTAAARAGGSVGAARSVGKVGKDVIGFESFNGARASTIMRRPTIRSAESAIAWEG